MKNINVYIVLDILFLQHNIIISFWFDDLSKIVSKSFFNLGCSAGADELNQATLICTSWYSGTLFTVE